MSEVSKNIVIRAYNSEKKVIEEIAITLDGTETLIKAQENINYEFFDESIQHAPNHIITKRVGEDLHVSFEQDGVNSDLVIEGFYLSGDHALIGIAEDGQYFYYTPDTGEVTEYVTQLLADQIEGQALGGEPMALPFWLPMAGGLPLWALGLAAIPLAFVGGGDSGSSTLTNSGALTDDRGRGEPGVPVTIKVVDNDKNIDPKTVQLIDPSTNKPISGSLIVPNEGTWSVDPPMTGSITFTPETGFKGDPTPIKYTATDINGTQVPPATVSIDYYPSGLNDDRKTGKTGQSVTVDVLGNDENNIDPKTVQLIDPVTGNPTNAPVVVAGQGIWSVDPNTGNITFSPEADFTGNPTPIKYTAKDDNGVLVKSPAVVTVDYPQGLTDDRGKGEAGKPVTISVVDNDTNIDPKTVQLIGPDGKPTTSPVVVPGEGTWSVNPTTGAITFTPDPTFKGDPTPIKYTAKDTNGNDAPIPATVSVDYPIKLNDDSKLDNPLGTPVTINVVTNDVEIDPATVKLIDSVGNITTYPVFVSGEGTWTVSPTGDVTFTPGPALDPVSGNPIIDPITNAPVIFKGDPTPIKYTANDINGTEAETPAFVTIGYNQPPVAVNDEAKDKIIGTDVIVDVLGNDTGPDGKPTIDKSSVLITSSPGGGTIAADGKSVNVPGEGVWTVDPTTGAIKFAPEPNFSGDPTPISYTVKDTSGATSNPAVVTVDYNQPTAFAIVKNHVSEEGLLGGIMDTNPAGIDLTNSPVTIANEAITGGTIELSDADGIVTAATAIKLTNPSTIAPLLSNGNPLIWVDVSTVAGSGLKWQAQNAGVPVLEIELNPNGTANANADGFIYTYTTKLLANIDHAAGLGENNLNINFTVEASNGATTIASEANAVISVVEDDAPIGKAVVFNIDVPIDVVTVDLNTSNYGVGFIAADTIDSAGNTGTIYTGYDIVTGSSTSDGDGDGLAEYLGWGYDPYQYSSNTHTSTNNRAKYKADQEAADPVMSSLTEVFKIGSFEHYNMPGYAPSLGSTTLRMKIGVGVNGTVYDFSTDYQVTHLETSNKNGSSASSVTMPNGTATISTTGTQNDFVFFGRNDNNTYLVDGGRYRLDLKGLAKIDNTTGIEEVLTLSELTSKSLANLGFAYDNAIFGKSSSTAYNRSFAQTSASFKTAIGAGADQGNTVAALTANRDKLITLIESGAVSLITTEEGSSNKYALKAVLTPIDEAPFIDDNINTSGSLSKGGDNLIGTVAANQPGGVVWTTADSDVTNANAVADANGRLVFNSRYGDFIANTDGSYNFKAAKDISSQVNLNLSEDLVFTYKYTDNDGDVVTESVSINFNDFTQTNRGTIDGTNDNDQLKGSGQVDTLNGGLGDDVLEGRAGADTLNGGAGNDSIIASFITTGALATDNLIEDIAIDGGAGKDTLILNSQIYQIGTDPVALNGNFDLSNIAAISDGIEAISLEQGAGVTEAAALSQSLTLTAADVLNLGGDNNTLFIDGDAADMLNIGVNNWNAPVPGTGTLAGYNTYTSIGGTPVTIHIDTDITTIM